MHVARLLGRRLLLLVPLMFGILLATFMLVRLSGQDPVALIAGPTASAEELALVRRSLNLDQPIWTQFFTYLGNVLQGDLGQSWVSRRPVTTEILERLPATLELLILGVGLGLLVAIPVGMRSALKPDGAFDTISRFVSLLGFSVPTYFLGLVMLFIFFYLLNWAPPGMGRLSLMISPPPTVTGSYALDALIAGDWEALRSALGQLVLPTICVAILAAAPIAKQTRAITLDVLSSEYVRYADAQGLPGRAVRKLVFRNSMTLIITFVATEISALVGSMALIEYVFAWGGVGQYGLSAVISGDFTVVQAYVLLLAMFSVLMFLVVDVVVLVIDPRAGDKA